MFFCGALTSYKLGLYPPFCSATCQLASVLLQLTFVLPGCGERTLSQPNVDFARPSANCQLARVLSKDRTKTP